MQSIEQVKLILADVLALGQRTEALKPDTALLGNFPELDSMAVISVITAMEERFNIAFDDEEINADAFRTLGSLSMLVDRKRAQ